MMTNIKKREEQVYRAVLNGELEIDSQGRVWRVSARRADRWTGTTKTIPCERRRAEHMTGAYLQVRAMFAGERANALAHRLVWLHFNGPIPDGLTINHKNGVRDDNRPENLELATPSEQKNHRDWVLGHRQCGQKNPNCRITPEQVAEIRQRRASGEKLMSIAQDFGIAYQTVSHIARMERHSNS